MLPEEVRTELERRIVERSFSGYQDLADWLQAQGYQIAHDSIQRHGARLGREIEAMEQLTHEARAIAAAIDHSEGTVVEVSIQLIHHRILAMLLEEPGSNQESSNAGVPANQSDSACGQALGLPDLARMTRILADLNRITMARQRQADTGGSQPRQPRHAKTSGGGLSEEAYHAIRNVLLGINPFDSEHRERSDGEDIPGQAPERYEPEGGEGNNNPDADGCAFQAVEPSCAASALSLLEPSVDAAEGAETQLDADRRSSTPKTGRVCALQGETVPVAAYARSALGRNATKPDWLLSRLLKKSSQPASPSVISRASGRELKEGSHLLRRVLKLPDYNAIGKCFFNTLLIWRPANMFTVGNG